MDRVTASLPLRCESSGNARQARESAKPSAFRHGLRLDDGNGGGIGQPLNSFTRGRGLGMGISGSH